MNQPTVVITHHAVSNFNHTVEDVDQWHKARWPECKSELGYWVGYNYVIEADGKVTQTRKHTEEVAHTIGMNNKSIGVCFMGNFDTHQPTPNQISAWGKLYGDLRKQYPDIPTLPHRAYANKSCHGSLLANDFFQIAYQRITLIDRLNKLIALLTRLLTQRRMK